MRRDVKHALSRAQCGAAATEFAIVATLFFALLLAVIEFARLMFIYSTAVEATRLGARLAVVCDAGDATVKERMATMLPLLTADKISITYPGAVCSAASCEPVTVAVQGLTVPLSIPLLSLSFAVPAFATSIPAESLSSTSNPICN